MLKASVWQARFREHLELRAWSERTIEGYLGEIPRLFDFLRQRKVASLVEVTPEHVAAYRLHLYNSRHRGRPLSLSTQSGRLSAVKTFFRFLRQASFLLLDPAAGVERPRVIKDLPRVLPTEKEVRRLIEAPDVSTVLGLRDRAILELLYATGIRNSELRELCLDDVQLARRLVVVRLGKGKKSRVVPMGEEAAYWLDEYLRCARPRLVGSRPERRVFLARSGRPILTRQALSEVVLRAARSAGLDKAITPHALRHAVATHMLRRGAGLRHLQEMLGHASAGTTQVYTRVEVSDLRRVHQRCHPREQRRRPPQVDP